MQVSKWGNRLAIRLPQAVVDALQVKEGDEIDISVEGARAFAVDREAANQRQDAQGIEDGRAVKREICIVVRRVGVRAPDEPVFRYQCSLECGETGRFTCRNALGFC
jgi:antitoxin component of MazEF toxin-antitoxin module